MNRPNRAARPHATGLAARSHDAPFAASLPMVMILGRPHRSPETKKNELVALAADQVLGHALAAPGPAADAGAGLRALAIAVFDALDRHPWSASHVTAPATLANTLRLLDRIGTLVTRTGLPAERHFAVAFSILTFREKYDPEVAFVETMTSSLYVENEMELYRHTLASDHLRAAALGPDDSLVKIAELAAKL